MAEDVSINFDTLISPETVIEPNSIVEAKAYKVCIDWITGEYGLAFRMDECLPVTRDNVYAMAELQGDVAKVLLRLRHMCDNHKNLRDNLGLDQGENGALWQALFGNYEDSVLNRLHPNKRGDAYNSLLGPISVLTFCDLMQKADPELFKKLNPLKIIASAEDDVERKIDLVLDFGTKNKDGKKVLRVVQLKTDRYMLPGVKRIDPENVKSEYLDGVLDAREARTMLGGARYLEGLLDAELRCFVALVPAFDARVCNNPLGILNNSYDAVEGAREFIQNARKEGLIPKRKKR